MRFYLAMAILLLLVYWDISQNGAGNIYLVGQFAGSLLRAAGMH